MKKTILFIAAVIAMYNAADAQKRAERNRQPDEQIIVNKEYDEHGNLLRYDSTYSFQWYSDTTFKFPDFGGWEDFFSRRSPFPDIFNDSLLRRLPFFRDFPNRFFSDEWQPSPFRFGFPDSSFFRNFSFQRDTSFFMGPDSSFMLPPGFIMPNIKSLRDFFREFEDLDEFGDPSSRFFFNQPPPRFDRFLDRDMQEEWDNLMERHRQEMEELYRKWERKEQKRIY